MNPIYRQQKEALDFCAIGKEILELSRTELYLNLRFLDVALSSLAFVPDEKILGAGTDGLCLYYSPDQVARLFRQGNQKVKPGRISIRCFTACSDISGTGRKRPGILDLACDLAAEQLIDSPVSESGSGSKSMFRRQAFTEILPQRKGTFRGTDLPQPLPPSSFGTVSGRAESGIFPDDHRLLGTGGFFRQPSPVRQKWEETRERMQTEMELFSKEASQEFLAAGRTGAGGKTEKRYDYREFLRKFSVLTEEMQTDPDSFDTFLSLRDGTVWEHAADRAPGDERGQAGEDFVVVLDTSMSCKGELIRRFLQETGNLLLEEESFPGRSIFISFSATTACRRM